MPILPTVDRYGFRGQAILLCALIWAALGINALLPLQQPPPRGLMHYALPRIFLRWAELPFELADFARGAVWILPAVFALLAANHPRRSNVALGILYVPAIGYALSYVGSFVMWLSFGSSEGNYRGATTAVLYVALCLLIRIIARVPANAEAPLTGPPYTAAPHPSGKRDGMLR